MTYTNHYPGCSFAPGVPCNCAAGVQHWTLADNKTAPDIDTRERVVQLEIRMDDMRRRVNNLELDKSLYAGLLDRIQNLEVDRELQAEKIEKINTKSDIAAGAVRIACCPKCNSGLSTTESITGKTYLVHCVNCHYGVQGSNREEAVRYWNNDRTADDPAPAENNELSYPGLLKACRCGSDRIDAEWISPLCYSIRCKQCVRSVSSDTRERAESTWNARRL